MTTTSDPAHQPSGIPQAIGADILWGLLPLYLTLVRHVPSWEFVGWRALLTLPVCVVIVLLRRQVGEVIAALRSPRVLGLLTLSALLIGANWLIYIVAIQTGHVLAASLGYYINPLVNVLAGTLFLGERMNRMQWIAVATAALGVSLLAWGVGDMLGISLALATTFCGYGLVRKLTPVGSLPGLTIETLVLLPMAAGLVAWHAAQPQGLHFGANAWDDIALLSSGIVTAAPLLLFAVAARRMDYSTLGFFQFIAPTIVFALGLFVFQEPLRPVQLGCFVIIWAAVGLFIVDLLAQRRAARAMVERPVA